MIIEAAQAGWDVFVFGIPLIALLVFGFFRLDQVFTSRKTENKEVPDSSRVTRKYEKSMRSDPDGRPWD